MVEIVFTIYDLDGTAAIDRTSDLVDNILIAPSINAVPFQNSSFTPTMSYNGTHSVVSLSFRLVCGSNAYGPNCVQCVDRDDEFGHFVCDTATGDKVCLEGYTNSLSNCVDCALAEGCGEF